MDFVQHVFAQRTAGFDPRMRKVLVGVAHADFLHHDLRAFIDRGDKRHHFIQLQLTEGITEGCFSHLAGVAPAPMSFRQTPANSHTGRTRQIIGWSMQGQRNR